VLNFLFGGLAVGSVFSALGLFLEMLSRIDIYYFFTGWDPRVIGPRPRGFNREPRIAAYACTIGLLVLLLPTLKINIRKRFAAIAVVFAGFYCAASVSGALLLAAGLVVLSGFYGYYRHEFKNESKLLGRSIAFLFAAAVVSMLILPNNGWHYAIRSKKEAYWDSKPTAVLYPYPNKFLAYFEQFDAGAIDFFVENPRHVLFGTGPGLITLPASFRQKMDSGPQIGVIHLISNFGIIGLALWLFMLLLMLRSQSKSVLSIEPEYRSRLLAFIFIVVLYHLQAGDFYIFALGMGLATTMSLPLARSQ
jgi:hypothetical protein